MLGKSAIWIFEGYYSHLYLDIDDIIHVPHEQQVFVHFNCFMYVHRVLVQPCKMSSILFTDKSPVNIKCSLPLKLKG
jgi:hypothetical protein